MSSLAAVPSQGSFFGRLMHWLDAMPHPAMAVEISATHVAAAQGSRTGSGIEASAVEAIPEGVVVPSPVELNIADPHPVSEALGRVLRRVQGGSPEVALLVPDQVVRVFPLHFDTFPRKTEEAIPLLRWRLKKSVPFDVEDTVVSYITQPPRAGGVDVLAAVARQRIVRQFEEILESAGLLAGVVLSSTLATLPLLEESRTTLLARLTGYTLTTVIVRDEVLCVHRCTQMSADAARLEPQALLEEIYPAVAYYQDTWRESIQQVRLAGFAPRFEEFGRAIEAECGGSVAPLADSSVLREHGSGQAKSLVDRQLESLVGWMLNRGA